MKKPLHIIYVPGLGDRKVAGQQKAIGSWKIYGVTVELCQMNWGDKQPWPTKLDKLLLAIDTAVKAGKDVGLVGASAGASAVINAYAARKDTVKGVVLIAGKVNLPDNIGTHYRKHSPAFITSAYDCEQALLALNGKNRRRILSRFGIVDSIVSKQNSIIPGAKNRYSLSVGHFFSIAEQLVFGAPSFIRFIKKQK